MFCAIAFEVIGTLCLKPNTFSSSILQVSIVISSYCCAFSCLCLTLKHLPVGIVYATWSGVGIISIAVLGKFFYKENLDVAAWIGIFFIIVGVIILNLVSKSSIQ